MKKRDRSDLTGRSFNRWTFLGARLRSNGVTKYLARCECGTERYVSRAHVTSGASRSCGCWQVEATSKSHRLELAGRVFGQLTVIRSTGKNKFGKYVWECSCECGKTTKVTGASLVSGLTKSCGCRRYTMRGEGSPRFKHGLSTSRKYLAGIEAKRRAAQRQRSPKWADNDAILRFYAECPDGWHVDHELPLQGKLISGLHVLNNLQYLPRVENQKKQNFFTPTIEVRK